MKRIFDNGRYANVTATLALIVALGGTSYAAITLPAKSVGSKQLKNRAVTNSKLRASSVTSAKVKNGSLLSKDFKTGQLPAGPPGATNVVVRVAGVANVPPGEQRSTVVSCQPGEKALSGGLNEGGPGPTFTDLFNVVASEPVADSLAVPTGWFVVAQNTSSSPNGFFGFVVCAKP